MTRKLIKEVLFVDWMMLTSNTIISTFGMLLLLFLWLIGGGRISQHGASLLAPLIYDQSYSQDAKRRLLALLYHAGDLNCGLAGIFVIID